MAKQEVKDGKYRRIQHEDGRPIHALLTAEKTQSEIGAALEFSRLSKRGSQLSRNCYLRRHANGGGIAWFSNPPTD